MRLPIPSPSAPPSALVAAAIAAGRLAAAPAQAAALPALDALYGALPAAAAAAASHRAAVVEWQTAMAAAAAASAARRRWRWRRGPPPSDAAPATTAVAVAPAAGTASRIEHRRETLLGRAADALVATGVVGVGLPPPHPPVPPVPPRGLALVGGVGAGKTLLMDAFVAAAAGVPGVRVRRLHTAELLAGVYARLRWWDAATHADRAAAGVGSPTEAAAAVALWGGGADGGSCAARDLSLGGDRLDCSPADAVGRVVPGWPEGLADGWTSGGSGFDDSLPPAAARVLCVDEVAVPDVGTRVVLGGVLRSLVGGGVVLVFTANRGVAEMDRSGSGGFFLEDLMDRDMVMVHVGEGGGGGGGAEGDWRVAAALRGVGRAEAVAEVPPLPGAGVPAAATAPQPPYPLSSDWRAGADAADTSCGAPFSGTLIPPVSNLGSFFTPLCTAIEAAVEARWTALTGTAWADAVSVALPPPTPGLSPLCIPHAVTLPPPPPPPRRWLRWPPRAGTATTVAPATGGAMVAAAHWRWLSPPPSLPSMPPVSPLMSCAARPWRLPTTQHWPRTSTFYSSLTSPASPRPRASATARGGLSRLWTRWPKRKWCSSCRPRRHSRRCGNLPSLQRGAPPPTPALAPPPPPPPPLRRP